MAVCCLNGFFNSAVIPAQAGILSDIRGCRKNKFCLRRQQDSRLRGSDEADGQKFLQGLSAAASGTRCALRMVFRLLGKCRQPEKRGACRNGLAGVLVRGAHLRAFKAALLVRAV